MNSTSTLSRKCYALLPEPTHLDPRLHLKFRSLQLPKQGTLSVPSSTQFSHPPRTCHIPMSSTETDSSNEVELNGLGDTDPGLVVDLDVAAWAGSNPNKRKEPEPASPSISSNGDALLVSDVKVGDKLLAKGHAPNGERAWFHAEVIGRRVPSQSALVQYTHTVEGSDDPRALPFPRTALVLEVDTLLAREWEAKRKATREPNLGELTGSSAGGSAGSSASHPIPSHPDPSHPAPSHPIPSHPIPSHPVDARSHPIPSRRRRTTPVAPCGGLVAAGAIRTRDLHIGGEGGGEEGGGGGEEGGGHQRALLYTELAQLWVKGNAGRRRSSIEYR